MQHKLQQEKQSLNHLHRLGLVGQQLAQIQPGAFASQTVGYAPPAAPASPCLTFLGASRWMLVSWANLGLLDNE